MFELCGVELIFEISSVKNRVFQFLWDISNKWCGQSSGNFENFFLDY